MRRQTPYPLYALKGVEQSATQNRRPVIQRCRVVVEWPSRLLSSATAQTDQVAKEPTFTPGNISYHIKADDSSRRRIWRRSSSDSRPLIRAFGHERVGQPSGFSACQATRFGPLVNDVFSDEVRSEGGGRYSLLRWTRVHGRRRDRSACGRGRARALPSQVDSKASRVGCWVSLVLLVKSSDKDGSRFLSR